MKKTTPSHITIKLLNTSDRKNILNMTRREKRRNYVHTQKGKTADFSFKVMHTRRQWNYIFALLKEKNDQSIILCVAKISFKNEG